MILLDTDILSLLMRGHEKVVERVTLERAVLSITLVSRLEILQGRIASVLKAHDSAQLLLAQQWFIESERFLSKLPTVWFDAAAQVEFERLLQIPTVRRIGRADVLIASIALANRATLITRNRKHFERIPNLNIVNWAD